MGTKMQKNLTDNSADALGAALFGAALHGARAASAEIPADLTMCATQGALRALLELELGEAADRAAHAITSAARARIALEPAESAEDKNKRVLLDLLGRVNWRHQRPLTLALVIGTAAHGAFVVWLDSPNGGPLRYERVSEETPSACAERLRAETLGTIGEAFAA